MEVQEPASNRHQKNPNTKKSSYRKIAGDFKACVISLNNSRLNYPNYIQSHSPIISIITNSHLWRDGAKLTALDSNWT
jgi:hypothetical protein